MATHRCWGLTHGQHGAHPGPHPFAHKLPLGGVWLGLRREDVKGCSRQAGNRGISPSCLSNSPQKLLSVLTAVADALDSSSRDLGSSGNWISHISEWLLRAILESVPWTQVLLKHQLWPLPQLADREGEAKRLFSGGEEWRNPFCCVDVLWVLWEQAGGTWDKDSARSPVNITWHTEVRVPCPGAG